MSSEFSGKVFSSYSTQVPEGTKWGGNNHISIATGTEWDHEALFITDEGQFVINSWSQRDGDQEEYRLVEVDDAAHWLVRNNRMDQVPEHVRAGIDAAIEKIRV